MPGNLNPGPDQSQKNPEQLRLLFSLIKISSEVKQDPLSGATDGEISNYLLTK